MNLPLINHMVAMVTEKKVSGCMGTWTMAAVRPKRRKMTNRLRATRMRSFTLQRPAIEITGKKNIGRTSRKRQT